MTPRAAVQTSEEGSRPLPWRHQPEEPRGSTSGSAAAEERFAKLLQRAGAPAALLPPASRHKSVSPQQQLAGGDGALAQEKQQQSKRHQQEQEGVRETSSPVAAAAVAEEEPFSYRTACSSPLATLSPCSRSGSKSSSSAPSTGAGPAGRAVEAGGSDTDVLEATRTAAAEEAAAGFTKSKSSSSSTMEGCSLSSSVSTTLVFSDADLKLLAASPPVRSRSSCYTPHRAVVPTAAPGSNCCAAPREGPKQATGSRTTKDEDTYGGRPPRSEDAFAAASETAQQTALPVTAAATGITGAQGAGGAGGGAHSDAAAAATARTSAPCSPVSSAGSATVPELDDLDLLLSAGSSGSDRDAYLQLGDAPFAQYAAPAAVATAAAACGEWSLLTSERRAWEDMRRADARAAAAVDEKHLEDAGKKTIWVVHQGFCTPVSWYEDTSAEDVQAAVLCACDVMLDDEEKEEAADAAALRQAASAAGDADARAAARALARERTRGRPGAQGADGGFVLRQIEPLPDTADVDSRSLFLDVCVLHLRGEESSPSPIASAAAAKAGAARGSRPVAAAAAAPVSGAAAAAASSSAPGTTAAAAAASAPAPSAGPARPAAAAAVASAAGAAAAARKGATAAKQAEQQQQQQEQKPRLLRVVKGRRVRFEEFGELVSGCTYLLERVGVEEAFLKDSSSRGQQQAAQGGDRDAAVVKQQRQHRLLQSLAGNRWRRLLVPVEPLLHIETQKAFQRMMRGSNLLKHTRYGYPHLRQFQLSADRLRLLWYTSSKTKDSSVLHLPLLYGIILGQKTRTFLNYRLPALQHLSFSLVFLPRGSRAAASAGAAASGAAAARGGGGAGGACAVERGGGGGAAAAAVAVGSGGTCCTATTAGCCRRAAASAADGASCLHCGSAAPPEGGAAAGGRETVTAGEAAATEKRHENSRAAAQQEEWVRQQIELLEVPPGARTLDLTCKDEFEYDYWLLGFKAVAAANKGLRISKKLLLSHSRRFRRALAQNNVTFKLTALSEVREPGQVGLEECMDLPWHPPEVLHEKYEGLQSRIQAAAAEIKRIDYHQPPAADSPEADGLVYAAVSCADGGQQVVDDAAMEQRRMSELLLQVFQLLADARQALKAFNVEGCVAASSRRRDSGGGNSSDEAEYRRERAEGSEEDSESEAVVVSISSAGDIKTRRRHRRCGQPAAAGVAGGPSAASAAHATAGHASSVLSFEEQFKLNRKKSVAAASLETVQAVQEQVKGGVLQLLQQAGPLTQEAQKLLENAVSLAAAAVSGGRLEGDGDEEETGGQQDGQTAGAQQPQWSPEELQQLKTINQLLWKAEVDLENVEDMLARSQQSDSPLAPVNIVASVSHLNQKLSDELQRWGSQLTSLMNGIVTKLNSLPQNIGALEVQAPEDGGAAGCGCSGANAAALALQRRRQRRHQQQQRRQQTQRMQEDRQHACSDSALAGTSSGGSATFARPPVLPPPPGSAVDSPSSVLSAAAAQHTAAAHHAAAAASRLLVDFS